MKTIEEEINESDIDSLRELQEQYERCSEYYKGEWTVSEDCRTAIEHIKGRINILLS